MRPPTSQRLVSGLGLLLVAVIAAGLLVTKRSSVTNVQATRPEGVIEAQTRPAPKIQRTPPTAKALLAPWEMQAKSTTLRVYIDVSASMRGFPAASHYVDLLRALKSIAFDAELLDYEVSTFGSKVNPPQRVASFEPYGNPALYTDTDTNLGLMLHHASTWDSDGVIIVVTDGVASTRAPTVAGDPSKTPSAGQCAAGSDVVCLAYGIADLVASGLGFWIVGITLPFTGDYWIEEGPKRGQKIRPAPPERNLYYWIGARNVIQGRKLAEAIEKRVREMLPTSNPMVLEVAPGTWSRWMVPSQPSVRPAPTAFCNGSGGRIRSVHPTTPPVTVDVAIATRGEFGVRIPLDDSLPKTPFTALLSVTPRLAIELAPALASDQFTQKWRTLADNGLWFDVCVQGRPHTALIDRVVIVSERWSVEPTAALKTFDWGRWHTDIDDTPDRARLTVNFKTFLGHLQKWLLGLPAKPPSQSLVELRFKK